MRFRWNIWKNWYKRCTNGRVHKIFVLFGIINSPTFEMAYNNAKYSRKYGYSNLDVKGD